MSNSYDPMDGSPPGSSVHRISQARILEWAAISFSMGYSQPTGWTWVSCTTGRFFTDWATRERKKESDLAQLCLILCGPMDSSLLGSSIHGVFQARILEWVAISFSKGATREALYIYVLIFKSIFNLDTKFSLKIIRI